MKFALLAGTGNCVDVARRHDTIIDNVRVGRGQGFTWEISIDMTSTLDRTDSPNRPRRTIPRPKSRLNYWITFFSGILLLGLLINQYMAWNQDLYIVNGFDSPLTVSINEGESITVQPQGHTKVSISEGDHTAVVSRKGAEDHTVKFTVENTIYYRVHNSSAFVLNPAGGGVLVQEDIAYKTSQSVHAPNSHKIYFGKEFFAFREIDYAFKKPPDEIKMEGTYKFKRYIGAVKGKPIDLIGTFPDGTEPDELLRFAEHFLTVNPNDRDLLWRYATMARYAKNSQRAVKFLGAGLERRPIRVDWHRTYQTLCDTGGDDDDKIISTYDRMLAEAPNDSVLLYLRGRLCAIRSQSAEYFKRAMKADPKNPYPPFALAYGLISAGQLDEARKYSATACKLSPDHEQMKEQLFEIRFALKEYDSLAAELQAKLAANPLDPPSHTSLLRALVAAGKTAEAKRTNEQYIKRVSDTGLHSAGARGYIERPLAYLLDDSSRFANISSREKQNNPNVASSVSFVIGLESGDPQRIGELVKNEKNWKTSTSMLLLGFAWQIAGDQAAAKKCFEDAAERFASGSRDDRETSRLLKQGDKLKLSEVDNLSRDRVTKAMVLVALAAGSPSNRTALLDRAEKLNTLNKFPHHLIRKTIASLRTGERK